MSISSINYSFSKTPALCALAIVLVASGTLRADVWKPPVGIPAPDFGITQTNLMYVGKDFAYSTGTAPYKDAGNGPYSHYIDNTASNATDTSNPYGTSALPRKTIPLNLAAGSVVEIHGGPYSGISFNGNSIGIYGTGTVTNPIFIRGVPGALPTFSRSAIVFGSYIIFEYLSFINDTNISHRPDLFPGGGKDSDHLVFRHLLMKGSGTNIGTTVAISNIGQWNNPLLPWSKNFVVWDCTISDYGDWQSEVENDAGGVVVNGFNASDVWILNNTIYHSGGDSCRIGSNPVSNYPTYTARRIYVGGNKFYDNRENGLDVKGCYDAVISQNEMHGGRPTSTSSGTQIAFHYLCDNIWIVGNNLYDAPVGISGSDGLTLYVIGNTIHDVDDGLKYWDSNNSIHMVANTIARVTNGINDIGASSKPHPVINNIITGLVDTNTGYHIKINSTSAAVSDMRNNVIYESNGKFRVFWGVLYTSLAGFKIGTGKGEGCLLSDPKFVDGAASNFKLQPTSPAKDAGTIPAFYTALFASLFPGNSIAFDLAGTLRPQGASWDIGAFELIDGGDAPMAPSNLQVVAK